MRLIRDKIDSISSTCFWGSEVPTEIDIPPFMVDRDVLRATYNFTFPNKVL